jgi:hypothetical protein
MLSTRILTVLSIGALVSLGCGDSGTGGSGGSGAGSSGGDAPGGSPGNGGDSPGGSPSDGGGGGGLGGDTPIGGESPGGAPGTGGAGGGAGLGFLAPCEENADCESNICHTYQGQGLMLCTIECEGDGDCPAPSDGCNGMGFCKPAP